MGDKNSTWPPIPQYHVLASSDTHTSSSEVWLLFEQIKVEAGNAWLLIQLGMIKMFIFPSDCTSPPCSASTGMKPFHRDARKEWQMATNKIIQKCYPTLPTPVRYLPDAQLSHHHFSLPPTLDPYALSADGQWPGNDPKSLPPCFSYIIFIYHPASIIIPFGVFPGKSGNAYRACVIRAWNPSFRIRTDP